ncbi:MAG: acetyl-CoA hydrolase [Saprospiraceae bacterium]|nr:acetyl-CoA hydrolase [Saprospiraceae bacterium]
MAIHLDELSIVDETIRKIGNTIVLAVPLAAGKPNHIVNAFYRKAKENPEIDLKICTALTLQRPKGNSELEQRFIDLFSDRIFGDYPDLDYELDRMTNSMPDNIQIIEFYFAPGKYLANDEAQRNYVSSNYTHVVRDVLDRNVNVIAQMVAKEEINLKKYFSLSSNPDTSMDVVKELGKRGIPHVKIAQVNQNMPFMYGDSMVEEDVFDYVLDDESKYYKLFGPPKMSVSDQDYMIGLYCSALVRDDGEIQIGIGSLGDATIYNLVLRQNQNEVYQEVLNDLGVYDKYGNVIDKYGDTGKFDVGLLGASEMIVDGFMHLYNNGIIKKKVYDHIGLQRLLNAGKIKEEFSDDILNILYKNNLIHERINLEDFNFLQKWGIFNENVSFKGGQVYLKDEQSVIPYVNELADLEFMKKNCLGDRLKGGQVMHGGFFLGPEEFYQWLREMPPEERKLINMRSVQKVNQLYGHEELDRLHRKNARFINTCMMQTLAGAAVSDGLEDGRVVSGVGGQYNFVAMAQELPDGHSILNLKSTRMKAGKAVSNIVPFYGHITIPRHLRDMVVTEYGIAFLRGKTDQEIIEELIKVSDSRFQNELAAWAKKAGKLRQDYVVPEAYRNNTPESYQSLLLKYKKQGFYPVFPFGTQLTDEEIELGKALKGLKADLDDKPRFLNTLLKSFFTKTKTGHQKFLKMMRLDHPKGIKEKLFQKLLVTKMG